MTVLKNGSVFYEGKMQELDILIEDGRIKRIGTNLEGNDQHDLAGLTILPGLIDAHVHFRDMGQEHKEDWTTGSRAAAAGGVTTVLDMPNNKQPVVDQEGLDRKRKAAGKSLVNYGLYIGATPSNIDTLDSTDAAAIKVYHGSSTGSLLMDRIADFARLMETANKLIVVHSENEELIKYFSEKYGHTKKHHRMRDNLAAAVGTASVVLSARRFQKRLHIAHMTTKEEVDILKAFKTDNITCEACPHHLLLTSDFFDKYGGKGKMNPPLRSQEDQDALWQAIKDGIVDIIATDHAPHTQEEKNEEFESCPCGVPGVQTMLPLLLNEVNNGRLTVQDIVRLCCTNPSRIFRIKNRGEIREGNYADFAIVDLEREETITDGQQHSKSAWTPFNGSTVRGWPVMTFVNGRLIYQDGTFTEARGVEIELQD